MTRSIIHCSRYAQHEMERSLYSNGLTKIFKRFVESNLLLSMKRFHGKRLMESNFLGNILIRFRKIHEAIYGKQFMESD